MKDEIIEYLGRRINGDIILIDQLVLNLKIYKECEKIIEDEGVVVSATSRDGAEVTKVNPAVAAYNAAFKNIILCCTKLLLTPQDQEKLKLVKPEMSKFDKDFN